MIKIRITFDRENPKEKDDLIKSLHHGFKILSISKEYQGRGKSLYSNVYIDVEKKAGGAR